MNVTGGPDMGMYEIDEAAKTITEAADPDANIIFGAVIDETMQGEVRITVVATNFEGKKDKGLVRDMTDNNSVLNTINRSSSKGSQDDDELEVPAFIRRKMK